MHDDVGRGGAGRPPAGDGAPALHRDTLRRYLLTLAIVVVVAVAATVALAIRSAGPGGVWLITPGHPQLRVNDDAGCPMSVSGDADVVNTFPGPPLVPAGPSAGLICQYEWPLVGGPPADELVLATTLDRSQAQQLAAVIRRIDLAPPSTAAINCPSYSFNAVTVIGLSYPGRADVGLWYATGDCPTLDNGRVGAWDEGNPTFYQGFANAMDRLAPPDEPTLG